LVVVAEQDQARLHQGTAHLVACTRKRPEFMNRE
jgi:hypothetical protein